MMPRLDSFLRHNSRSINSDRRAAQRALVRLAEKRFLQLFLRSRL